MTAPLRIAILLLIASLIHAQDATLSGAKVTVPGKGAMVAYEAWQQEARADWPDLRPGLYHLALDGFFQGKRNVRYRLGIAVTQGDSQLAAWHVAGNRFTTDQRFPIIVTNRGPVTVTLSLVDGAREQDRKDAEEQMLKSLDKPEITGPDEEETIDITLEDIVLPASRSSFLLRAATLSRQDAQLVVTRVWPDKIHYRPGETVTVDTTVHNVSGGPLTGTVAVSLEYDLDAVIPLGDAESVTVAPGATATVSRRWVADRELGFRAVGSVTEGPRSHRGSEVFSVAENVFEVSIQGWSRIGVMNSHFRLQQMLEMPADDLAELSRDSALSTRANYINHIEMFSWAPDDFFNLAPAGESWWSGTMTYLKVKRDIIAELRAVQAQGIRVLSYAQPFAIGLDTQKNLRTDPELFAYSGTGSPYVSYDYDLLKSRARQDMGLRPQEIGGGLNFYNLDTVDRGIDALVASWQMFGFDGVRFDNRYYRANNPITWEGKRATEETNLDPYSARNVKRIKDRMRSETTPHYLISHNNGYSFNTPDNTLGWQETVKDGLMCMDEETCNADAANFRLNPWRAFMLFGVEARTACTDLGGYYQLFAPGRGEVSAADMVYYLVACSATGSHPIHGDPQFSAAGAYGEFMTRYAAVVFASDRRALPAEELGALVTLTVPDERPVWWQAFAHQRDVGVRRWLILPVVNPPVNERINTNPSSLVPAPLQGMTLRLAAPEAARVFFLTAESATMRQELPITDGQVAIPTIAHHAFIVVEVPR